jgi:PAS domain S-box-containing protein
MSDIQLAAYNRALSEHAMVSQTDIYGHITYVNEYFCEVTGFTREELIGKNHRILSSGSHSPQHFEKMYEDLVDGRSWRGTLKNQKKDGSFFWVDVIVSPLKNQADKTIGFLRIHNDVSSQIEASEQIKKSEEQLKQAQTIAKMGSWSWDVGSGRMQWTNQMFQIFSFDGGDGTPNLEVMISCALDPYQSRWRQKLEECLKTGSSYFVQIQVWNKNEIRWIEAQGYGHKDELGRVNAIFGTCQDITEQHLIQEELINTRNLLKDILDSMPGPVYSKAANGDYLFVNEEFIRTVAMRTVNPIGKTDYDIFDIETADSVRANDFEVMRSKKRFESIEQVPHLDGSLRTYESYKFPTFDQNQNVQTVTGISFDVTEKMRIRKELELERSRLIQASKMTSLGEMAGGIAHEINNPLAIIRGYSLRLKALFFQDEAPSALRAAKITDDILKAVDRTSRIIGGLKNFARDASNEKLQMVSVKKVIEETEALCRSRFSELHVRLVKDVEADLFLECQEIQMSQVLLNLLSNALDATMDSSELGRDRQVLIRAFAERREATPVVRIQVCDFGIGFSEESARRFVEPFFSTKEPGRGTGLGLSISRGLVEKHKGTISIESMRNPTIVEIQMPDPLVNKCFERPLDAQ